MKYTIEEAKALGFTHVANIAGLLIEIDSWEADDIFHFRFLSRNNRIEWESILKD